MSRPDPAREDLEASIAARRELGPDYEPALVESFLDRIEERAEQRLRERDSEHARVQARDQRGEQTGQERQFYLALVSLGTGIPISGIAAGTSGVAGLVVAWCGIGAVNLAHAWSQRRRRS
jgi:hypothetical protein